MLNMDGGKLGQGCPKGAVGFFGEWGLGSVGGGRDGVGKGDLGHLIALLGLKLYIRVDYLSI